GFYLSNDTNFTTDDYFIGALNVSSLNPDQTATLTFNGDLPEVPNGSYFVGFILDYNDRVNESDERNNNECFFTNPKVNINKNTGGYSVGGSPACACESERSSSFCDNFEKYSTSTFINRAPCWTTWSGASQGQELGYLIGDGSNQCMRIEGRTVNNQNMMLKLGDRNSGNYRIDFGMRTLSSKRGYFTLMQGTGNQASHSCQVILYNNGTGTVKHGTGETHFYYPNNNAAGWFKVSLMVDLDSDKASLMFNDSHAATWKYSQRVGVNATMKQLAALNFTAMDHSYLYDIDEIEFRQIASSENGDIEARNDDFATSTTLPSVSVSYYPNPVSGNLFLDIETPLASKVQVEIVNAIGQVVARHEEAEVTVLNKVFDLSNQAGGMYYIKCLIGDQQIVKPLIVIKALNLFLDLNTPFDVRMGACFSASPFSFAEN
ncbi:MAG: T9SS type A sorting domain-containing protein, partial [Saprospiraceae bacterium]|nr:T9SS type A sorting domain-containing protein [Saprospiraceae bacterium]